jgi:tetratricopeptide (TPR) repeat protein
MHFHVGWRYYLMRQWDPAIKQLNNALELDPHYVWAHCVLGLIYVLTGRFEEGIRTIETAAQISGQDSFTLGFLGHAYARAGRTGEARKILEKLKERSQKIYVLPTYFMWIYLSLGEMDQAFGCCEKMIDDREPLILQWHADPRCDIMRSHTCYHTLLRKMNLEP